MENDTESNTGKDQLFFKTGQQIVIPEGVVITESCNKDKPDHSSTPNIMTAFVHRHNHSLIFGHTQKTIESPIWKRCGIFLPKYAKPGDTIELDWVEPTCACSRIISRSC